MATTPITLTGCSWHAGGNAVATIDQAREHVTRWRERGMAAQHAHDLSCGDGPRERPCCPAAAYARELMAAAYREEVPA